MITEADHVARHTGIGLTIDPGLTLCSIGMRTKVWGQAAELEPANEKLGRRRSQKTADIMAEHRDAAQPHTLAYFHADAKAVKRAERVSTPVGGVALNTGIPGARKNPGTKIRTKLLLCCVTDRGLVQGIKIARLQIASWLAIKAVNGLRHEILRRFVQIVPDGGHTR